jgi:hypothetical protein
MRGAQQDKDEGGTMKAEILRLLFSPIILSTCGEPFSRAC